MKKQQQHEEEEGIEEKSNQVNKSKVSSRILFEAT